MAVWNGGETLGRGAVGGPDGIAPWIVPAVGGLLGGLFGGGGRSDSATSRFSLDPRALPYLEESAGLFRGLLGQEFDPQSYQQFLDPYLQDVIGGVQGDFDRQRGLALTRSAQEATGAGAFGGSRSGILQAQSLRDVNDLESRTLSGLRSGGFNAAMARALGLFGQQQQLGLAGAGGLLDVGRSFGGTQTQTSRSGGGFGGALAGGLGGFLGFGGGDLFPGGGGWPPGAIPEAPGPVGPFYPNY